ncbi:MAG: polysaccharide deacetylase family protein [Chitinophagales bacterium]
MKQLPVEANKILIYAPQNSSRLQYTLQLIFHDLLGIEYEFTIDLAGFHSSTGAKINYSRQQHQDAIFFQADELLFDNGIKPLTVMTGEWQAIKTLFHHALPSDLPFDPFAATFYLVSRYEEYLPFQPDDHGRFPAEQSLNYKTGFHKIPVVNHYALFIKQLLLSRYPGLIFPEKKYQFRLTYDIDMAFAFREKGAIRNAGGFLRSLKNLNLKEIALRTKVLTGFDGDPFDTFSYQQSLHERYEIHPVYFFLLGDHSLYDKNISWRNTFFSSVVQDIAAKNEIGIHASYESNKFPKKVAIEKERLEKISGKKVFRNRQHFLKLQFPGTYQKLLAAGITEDYTMGYSSQTGFRAGIAAPFYFYDLEKETATNLVIYPFAAMDAALYYNLELNATAALQQTKQLVDEVKKVNGLFIFLAHNDLISINGPWKDWSEKFEELIEYFLLL